MKVEMPVSGAALAWVLAALLVSTASGGLNRRILHHPFFPVDFSPPGVSPALSPPDKYPLYGSTPAENYPFFPSESSPPPPSPASLAIFPANFSSVSVSLPVRYSSVSAKLVTTAIAAVVAAVAIVTLAVVLHLRRPAGDGRRSYFGDKSGSRGSPEENGSSPFSGTGGSRIPKLLQRPSKTSAELLYLGTLANSRAAGVGGAFDGGSSGPSNHSTVQVSPDIRPLPPLRRSQQQHVSWKNSGDGEESSRDDFSSEFHSPKSSANGGSNFVPPLYSSPVYSSPPESTSVPVRRTPPSVGGSSFPASSSPSPPCSSPEMYSKRNRESGEEYSAKSDQAKIPSPSRPPPPLPPPGRPIENQPPSIPSIDGGDGSSDRKPKLKPLHWDKVRASSDREMVWDQLRSNGSTFTLDEEMIQTLFVVNAPKPNPKETTTTKWQVLPAPNPNHDNGNRRILDPKKSQNIAILLRALHLTADDVCKGLLQGNTDILGSEFLESLLKMAPTEEEERKLKECAAEGDSLDAAERFLEAVLCIPFAFKRMEILLYVSNFDSEAEYLKKSFATLKAACEELSSSRMFLKLLEAVLKTGNRMNVGTDRGDARAFKLDTLLKLVDVKGADGRTTLLHFVVQEIIRSEVSGSDDDVKCRKLGLRVVAGLSSELSNVKRAAAMDAEALTQDVAGLREGLRKLGECFGSSWEGGSEFSGSVGRFAARAEEAMAEIEAEESEATRAVKEITEYFHGNSVIEEAHPFRIFTVVRDFLTVLDRVCEEFGSGNDRSARKFVVVPVNPTMMNRVAKQLQGNRRSSSSSFEEDE